MGNGYTEPDTTGNWVLGQTLADLEISVSHRFTNPSNHCRTAMILTKNLTRKNGYAVAIPPRR